MKSQRTTSVFFTLLASAFVALPGCEKKAEPTTPSSTNATPTDHAHTPGDGHDHAHDSGDSHDHGAVTALGEQAIGGLTIRASREGNVTPGGDAPINAWISGGATRPTAVRFWIGTQDAKGSMKTKANLEDDHYHTHTEVPKPLPEGSKLWVEVESDKGEKIIAGFDLAL